MVIYYINRVTDLDLLKTFYFVTVTGLSCEIISYSKAQIRLRIGAFIVRCLVWYDLFLLSK